MTQFAQLRARMVDNQLRTSGVTDWDLLSRMGTVPRELFVPDHRQAVAYIDDIHRWGEGSSGRFMMAPATLAKLLQLAEISRDDTVLDVGATTGYAVAVIAGLAGSVVGLEADEVLAAKATTILNDLGVANASMVKGDVSALGRSTFDVVFVEGSLDKVPEEMVAVLNEGGRLIAVIREGGVSVANVFVKSGSTVAARGEFNVTLPALDQTVRAPEFVF